MVLHTWNQRLEHHPHLHALVPGGGPSPDGQQWVRSGHRHHQRRDKPYLVDNRLLSERFRDKFLAGLTRLHRDGQLKLQGPWSHLREPAAFAAWLQTFRDCDWVVYIEPPPTEQAQPRTGLEVLGAVPDRRPDLRPTLDRPPGRTRSPSGLVAKTSGPGTNRNLIRSTESSSPVAGRCTFCPKASSSHAASAASAVGIGRPTSAAVAQLLGVEHTGAHALRTRPRTNPRSPSPVRSAKHRWSAFPTSSVQAGTAS